MKRRFWITLLLLICLGLVVVGTQAYRAFFGKEDNSAPIDEQKTFAIAEVSKLRLKTVSADVRLSPSDGDRIEVELRGTTGKQGAVTLKTQQQGGQLTVEVQQKQRMFSWFSLGSSLTLDVKVPKEQLKEIAVSTVSGDQEWSGMQASSLESSSTSGEVSIQDSLGKLKVTTVSGDQQLEGIQGEGLTASSVSGEIGVSGSELADWSVHSVSGDVTLDQVTGPVKVKTTSGEISLDLAEMAAVSAESVSGDVQVQVPKEAEFQLAGKSVSGSIRVNADGFETTDASKSHYRGGVGKGGPAVEFKTVSGEVKLSN